MRLASGGYRRRIELVTASPGLVRGELEDDFHHFRVGIAHEAGRVTAVDGDSPRHPWTTCPGAFAPLQALVGRPVLPDATAHGGPVDVRAQCTHWFDLAGLAIAQAATGVAHRRYDVVVGDRDADRTTTAHLARDGEPVLTWTVDAFTVHRPEAFAGRDLGRGFPAWARANFDPDTAEAVIVLRRACRISLGRTMDLDAYDRASEVGGPALAGTCHTFTAGRMEEALRVKGATRR